MSTDGTEAPPVPEPGAPPDAPDPVSAPTDEGSPATDGLDGELEGARAANDGDRVDEDTADGATTGEAPGDLDATVNLTGDSPFLQQLQDRLDPPLPTTDVTRSHLKGLLEALVFASDHPQKAPDLAKAASAGVKEVRDLLAELKSEYHARGIQLDEVAGGWIFRTSSAYAPFVRDLTKQKPVRLSRAQVETLAILAYRQPVTRPEIDDIRGVDSGPVLKVLLERDLVRILGKKDEPGRPMIYGTTTAFLEFFGLKSLKDLPTLREFTELTEDSRRVAERELGEELDRGQPPEAPTEEPPVVPEQPREDPPGGVALDSASDPVTATEPAHETDEADDADDADDADGK